MPDNHTIEQRSRNMSHIRSGGTKPEMLLRKHLFSKGYRYRVNDRRYPGKPDIVLPKYKTAIFVNGCFWHQHAGCKYSQLPKSNIEYWLPKLERNVQRDMVNHQLLADIGWKVIVVWECELSKDMIEQTYKKVLYEIGCPTPIKDDSAR